MARLGFLMCRVELKVGTSFSRGTRYLLRRVPNVPCGVESRHSRESGIIYILFLMCRVELKAQILDAKGLEKNVPNVPCGVESP